MNTVGSNAVQLSPHGDVLRVQGSLGFLAWPDFYGFTGQMIDLGGAEAVDSAGLGMLLRSAKQGVRITGCAPVIRSCLKVGGVCAFCQPVGCCATQKTP